MPQDDTRSDMSQTDEDSEARGFLHRFHLATRSNSKLDEQLPLPVPSSPIHPKQNPRRRLQPISLTPTTASDCTSFSDIGISQPRPQFVQLKPSHTNPISPISDPFLRNLAKNSYPRPLPKSTPSVQEHHKHAITLRELEKKVHTTSSLAAIPNHTNDHTSRGVHIPDLQARAEKQPLLLNLSKTLTEKNACPASTTSDSQPSTSSCSAAEVQRPKVKLSLAFQQAAIIHAHHIRSISNDHLILMQSLQSLHELPHSVITNIDPSSEHGVCQASYEERYAYRHLVYSRLEPLLTSFPTPIQRAFNVNKKTSEFRYEYERTWIPLPMKRLYHQLPMQSDDEVKPFSGRLRSNLEKAWDTFLVMLRTYCGHKEEAPGTFVEKIAIDMMSYLHPCNVDIFANRFVSLLDTYTIRSDEPSHIRRLNDRLRASSASLQTSTVHGAVLHRVPELVLAAFGDLPVHAFYVRFLARMDSARLFTALLPRFLRHMLHTLGKAATANSNSDYCDLLLESCLYARFLAVIMHASNWSHSSLVISGPRAKNPRRVQRSDSKKEKKTKHEPVPQTDRKSDSVERRQNMEGAVPIKSGNNGIASHSKCAQSSKSENTRNDNSSEYQLTPGLGPYAIGLRAPVISAFWSSIMDIDELICDAVGSGLPTAVVAVTAIADVLLRLAGVDPTAKTSEWFRRGIQAMRNVRVIDRVSEMRMPVIEAIVNELLGWEHLNAKQLKLTASYDERYVLHCDLSEWGVIGNLRFLQECCPSLASFCKGIIDCSKPMLHKKTASRRITPWMTSSATVGSRLRGSFGIDSEKELSGDSKRKDEEDTKEDVQEKLRRQFVARMDVRLRELMQMVVSSRPESEEGARNAFLKVCKILYPDVVDTVRAVAAHICGHRVGVRLRQSGGEKEYSTSERNDTQRGDKDVKK